MRAVFFIILISLAHGTMAQKDTASVNEKFRLLRNTLTRQVSRLDTIRLPSVKDSLTVTTPDSLKQHKLLRDLSRADSLRPGFTKSGLTNRIGFNNRLDLDTVERPKIQGLNKLPGDSVNGKLEAASGRINHKVDALQSSLRAKTDSLHIPQAPAGLQDKLNSFKSPGREIQLPATSQSQLTNPVLPETDLNIPPIGMNKNAPDLKIPGTQVIPDLPALQALDQKGNPELPAVNILGQNDIVPDLSTLDPTVELKGKVNLPSAELPSFEKPDSAQINKLKAKALEDERLKEYVQPFDKISDHVDPYKKNLDSITLEDVGNIVSTESEDILGNTRAVKTVNEQVKLGQAALATQQQVAMMQRYQDKKILKEEMLRKAKNVMNDKITGLTPQVQEQQKKLGKAKRLNGSVASVKNLKQKRSDPLRERPFYERLVPGVSLQSYSGNVFALDLSPQLVGRITSYWSAGGGILHRSGFDKKYPVFVSGQGVNGFRTFIEYRLVKGLFIHGEYEQLTVNHRFEYAAQSKSPEFRSAYLGLGKQYPISRKLYGSLIALYKFEMNDHLMGTTRFNLRVVFEYKTKKVRKPTAID